MNGHWRYADLDVAERKRLLACFSGFVRRLPVTYVTFNYRMSEVENTGQLARRMFQDVCGILNEHLAYFQGFDQLKVYYDDGQPSVYRALHSAVEDSISRQAIVYRGTRFESFRLAQTADYLCAIELLRSNTSVESKRRLTRCSTVVHRASSATGSSQRAE